MFNVMRLQGVIISKQFCRQHEHETENMVCTIRWTANAFAFNLNRYIQSAATIDRIEL